jgi:hypothetical protein
LPAGIDTARTGTAGVTAAVTGGFSVGNCVIETLVLGKPFIRSERERSCKNSALPAVARKRAMTANRVKRARKGVMRRIIAQLAI